MQTSSHISTLRLIILCALLGFLTTMTALAQKVERASTANQDISFHPSDDPAEAAANAQITPKENAEKADNTSEAANPLPNLRIFGSIRHRSEVNARFATPGENVPRFHLLRTRLNVSFEPAKDITAFVQIQDSRVFGGQNPALGRGTLDGSADALDFHQAYFKVNQLFDMPLELKVGRQMLMYGNQRYIGGANWHNIGRTFDAAILSFKDKHRRIDLISSKLVATTSALESQNLHGMYGTFHFLWSHHADLFFLYDNNSESMLTGVDAGKAQLSRYTAGGLVYGKDGSFIYELELAGQRGKMALTDSTARANLNGFLVVAKAGLMGSGSAKFKATFEYGLASGDNTPEDNNVDGFTMLFPSGFKFAGFMNYFPAAYPNNGLQNFTLHLASKVSDRLALKLDSHHFVLHHPFALGGQNRGTLGQEFDLTASFRYNGNFTVASGASFFAAQPLMEEIIGGKTASWFYITTMVNF